VRAGRLPEPSDVSFTVEALDEMGDDEAQQLAADLAALGTVEALGGSRSKDPNAHWYHPEYERPPEVAGRLTALVTGLSETLVELDLRCLSPIYNRYPWVRPQGVPAAPAANPLAPPRPHSLPAVLTQSALPLSLPQGQESVWAVLGELGRLTRLTSLRTTFTVDSLPHLARSAPGLAPSLRSLRIKNNWWLAVQNPMFQEGGDVPPRALDWVGALKRLRSLRMDELEVFEMTHWLAGLTELTHIRVRALNLWEDGDYGGYAPDGGDAPEVAPACPSVTKLSVWSPPYYDTAYEDALASATLAAAFPGVRDAWFSGAVPPPPLPPPPPPPPPQPWLDLSRFTSWITRWWGR